MKIIMIICFLLSLCTYSYASNTWSDLEVNETYRLTHDLSLSSSLNLNSGSSFYFEELVPTDIYFHLKFRQTDCPSPDLLSDLILYNPSPEDPYFNRSVGLKMEEGCLLNIYIEPTDYYTRSLF